MRVTRARRKLRMMMTRSPVFAMTMVRRLSTTSGIIPLIKLERSVWISGEGKLLGRELLVVRKLRTALMRE